MALQLAELMRMKPDELDEAADLALGRKTMCEWDLALCLLAIEESRAFLMLGYASIMDYAERGLGLDHWLAASLMTVVRKVAPLPAISEALAEGRICWAKARTLVSVLTSENERQWLDYAVRVTARKLQKAVTIENEALRRQVAEQASAPTRAALAARKARPRELSPEVEELLIAEGIDPADIPKPEPFDPSKIKTGPKPPQPPAQVSVTLRFNVDEYAIFEAAIQRVCQRDSKAMGEATALVRVMREFLASGDARVRTNHPVVIHVDGPTGVPYYETRRGCFPASDEAVADAMSRGLQKEIHATPMLDFSHWPTQRWSLTAAMTEQPPAAASRNDLLDAPAPEKGLFVAPVREKELLEVPVCDGGPYLEAPSGLPQQFLFPLEKVYLGAKFRKQGCSETLTRIDRLLVFMRAGWRCEQCGSRDDLEIDHEVPRCLGGTNEPHLLRLLCKDCHTARHLREHADDPHFVRGRERAGLLPAPQLLNRNT